jgi:hypothetical protein
MINELVQELRSYPAHYVAAHRAADALEKREYYNCRLEDDLVKLEAAAESLREHIAQQQLDIVTLGQEVGRLREALEKIASAPYPDTRFNGRGMLPDFDGFKPIARAALGEEKK